MKLLVGECSGRLVEDMRLRGWGRMWVQRRIAPYPGEPWGFDNGAYGAFRRGEEFPVAKYRARLQAARLVGTPWLAVIPDRVAQLDSLRYSRVWMEQLPRDWPWYLALQDGMRPEDLAPFLGEITGLFLGGSDRFKRCAAEWAAIARSYGLAFHYGRASSFQKLEHALAIGATSADSTVFQWTKAKWRRLLDWWDDSRVNQGSLV